MLDFVRFFSFYCVCVFFSARSVWICFEIVRPFKFSFVCFWSCVFVVFFSRLFHSFLCVGLCSTCFFSTSFKYFFLGLIFLILFRFGVSFWILGLISVSSYFLRFFRMFLRICGIGWDISPACQVRVVRFYVRCAAPPSSCPFLISSFLAGPHLPALDCSGPGRTSSASPWSQWSSPDTICQRLIAVVRRRTSSASTWWRTPNASARSLWASPDFNRREPERCEPRRNSTGESLNAVGLAGLQPARVWAAVGLAGLQPARVWALWASPDFTRARVWALWAFNRTSTARNKAI